MKKIIFLVGCLFISLSTANGQNVNTANINELLMRLDSVENKIGAEPDDLFTTQEKEVLRDYFNTVYPENSLPAATADDAYVYQIRGGCNGQGFGTFPLSGPYDITYISTSMTKFYGGDQDDEGNFYGVRSDTWDENGYLVKINPETGEEVEIGRLNMEKPHVVTGIAWNKADRKWYVLSSNSDYNRVYTVDVNTAQLTTIGNGQLASRLGIWLVIDNEGKAYTADIGNHQLYRIDLSTGIATKVGFMGVAIRNAQDADFDPDTGILYAAGHLGGGVTRLFAVNTNTGEFVNTGTVNNSCANIGFLSIKSKQLNAIDSALKEFSFYPNPATTALNLKSSINIDNVRIYSLSGQLLINDRINRKDAQVNVSTLSKGSYIMKVEINGKAASYKFIKN